MIILIIITNCMIFLQHSLYGSGIHLSGGFTLTTPNCYYIPVLSTLSYRAICRNYFYPKLAFSLTMGFLYFLFCHPDILLFFTNVWCIIDTPFRTPTTTRWKQLKQQLVLVLLHWWLHRDPVPNELGRMLVESLSERRDMCGRCGLLQLYVSGRIFW